jgi:tetratricopeptide (TPR) repeat protein
MLEQSASKTTTTGPFGRGAGTADPAALEKAEKLTIDAHPSRAARVGWILNRMNEPERSLPLLKEAVARAADDDLRQSAAFTLFESYLDLGRWREAEAMFSDASARLTSAENPEWLAKIAVLAVRDEAKDDAMRIFRRVANMNLRTPLVDRLAEWGLRPHLAEFYAEVAQRLPPSEAIDEIRDRLRLR